MVERDVSVVTKYGAMPAFAAYPDSPAPVPPVILYMDAPGTREELRNMARRIAKMGYYCLLPDLYYFSIVALAVTLPRLSGWVGVVRSLVFTGCILGVSYLLTRRKIRMQL